MGLWAESHRKEGGGENESRQMAVARPYLVILRQDAVHVCNVLAGDLLDNQRSVVGVEEQSVSMVINAPHWGASGQRHLDIVRPTVRLF